MTNTTSQQEFKDGRKKGTEKGTGKGAKRGPDRLTFCQAWQNSESVAEVAELLDMEPANVMSRASYYRAQGIQLKEFRRGRPRSPVSASDVNQAIRVDAAAVAATNSALLLEILACLAQVHHID